MDSCSSLTANSKGKKMEKLNLNPNKTASIPRVSDQPAYMYLGHHGGYQFFTVNLMSESFAGFAYILAVNPTDEDDCVFGAIYLNGIPKDEQDISERWKAAVITRTVDSAFLSGKKLPRKTFHGVPIQIAEPAENTPEAVSLIVLKSGVIMSAKTWVINTAYSSSQCGEVERELLRIAAGWVSDMPPEEKKEVYDPDAILENGYFEHGADEVLIVWSQETIFPETEKGRQGNV